jgi:dephospho-CoA kinase
MNTDRSFLLRATPLTPRSIFFAFASLSPEPRGILRKFLPPDEPVVLCLRPSILFVFLRPRWLIGAILLAMFTVRYATRESTQPHLGLEVATAGGLLILAVILWEIAQWLSRLYVMTDRRLIAIAGLLSQNVSVVPLRNIRNVVIVRSFLERLTGLGTLGAATAGTDGYELVWLLLDRPHDVLQSVRAAVEGKPAATPPAPQLDLHPDHEDSLPPDLNEPMTLPPLPPPAPQRPVVIGLTGGVGAGKSEVAHLLARHGFTVIDSDKEAKEALDRPVVREQLVEWWGPRVLTPDGRIDRRAVAQIIFSDDSQRTRLEQLVHPLVKATRAALIDRAAREGSRGVVIDAPLLLEAGSDAECDLIIFVDAPRDQRISRVQTTRNWDQAELTRRENAQLPLEAKRRRSDEVIVNDSSPQVLEAKVADLVHRILTGQGPAAPLADPCP